MSFYWYVAEATLAYRKGQLIGRAVRGVSLGITRVKRFVLATLKRRGYIVLKRPDYEHLRAKAGESTPQPLVAPPPAFPGAFPDETPSLAQDVGRFAATAGISADFDRRRLLVVFLIARYLENARVEGAVVDCGDGSPQTLSAFASALMHFGQTRRQIVLCDTTVDPAHRAGRHLPLWGNDRDLIGTTIVTAYPMPEVDEPPPEEILGTGYPSDRISICRYQGRPLDAPQRVAFLGITNETYGANLAGIRVLASRMPSGGVIAVSSAAPEPHARIIELLQNGSQPILFLPVAKDYLVGVKP